MALEISREKQPPEGRLTVSMYQVKDRLYETADGDIVEEGHADAAFLFATPGDEIPLEVAEERGLVKRARKRRDKQAPKPADK